MAINIRDIDHLVLRVSDLGAMLTFYCEVLGCTLERQLPEYGLHQVRAGMALIDFVTVDGKLGKQGGDPPGSTGRNLDHFCLRLDPFDEQAILKHLTSMGVTPGEIHTRYGAQGFGPSIYVTDPEGNTVELKGPPDIGGR